MLYTILDTAHDFISHIIRVSSVLEEREKIFLQKNEEFTIFHKFNRSCPMLISNEGDLSEK